MIRKELFNLCLFYANKPPKTGSNRPAPQPLLQELAVNQSKPGTRIALEKWKRPRDIYHITQGMSIGLYKDGS